MKKVLIVTFVLLAMALTGCSLTEDLKGSAALIQTEFDGAKDAIDYEIDSAKDLYDDVKTAAEEVQEAREALHSIGN